MRGSVIAAGHQPGRVDAVFANDGVEHLESWMRIELIRADAERDLANLETTRCALDDPVVLSADQPSDPRGNGVTIDVWFHGNGVKNLRSRQTQRAHRVDGQEKEPPHGRLFSSRGRTRTYDPAIN